MILICDIILIAKWRDAELWLKMTGTADFKRKSYGTADLYPLDNPHLMRYDSL